MVETLYANQPVMGSPFFVEIYDPNKIRIEGGTTGTVGLPVDFEGLPTIIVISYLYIIKLIYYNYLLLL